MREIDRIAADEGAPASPSTAALGPVVAALVALYFIWGSTYLAMRIALEGYPPLVMAGARYVVAGSFLFAFVAWRGHAVPTRGEWLRSAVVGFFLLVGGNGGVSLAEHQGVSSGVAAVMVAAMPLWAALFAGAFGTWPRAREWAGLALGAVGVVVLNLDGDLRARPLGAVVLLASSASWAFGSVVSGRLRLPSGAMASAAQMLTGGAVLLALGYARGESWPRAPSLASSAALGYLVIFGSIVAFSAYGYLLRAVRPSLATSYAFVNPPVAVLLGGLFGERVTPLAVVGMVVILAGVALVAFGRAPKAKIE